MAMFQMVGNVGALNERVTGPVAQRHDVVLFRLSLISTNSQGSLGCLFFSTDAPDDKSGLLHVLKNFFQHKASVFDIGVIVARLFCKDVEHRAICIVNRRRWMVIGDAHVF